MKYWVVWIFLWIMTACQFQSKEKKLLVAGPMLGHTTHRSVSIWLEVNKNVDEVTMKYWPVDDQSHKHEVHYKGRLGHPYNSIQMTAAPLSMNTLYHYQIFLNGQKTSPDTFYQFKTKRAWRQQKKAPEISFLLGSCSFINDSIYDRPGEPYGQDPSIFKAMYHTESDFMLWLGDNTYLREADYSSATGIRYRYHHTRQHPALQPLLTSRPHYAIWDDHDYGPNNSNRSFSMKTTSLTNFKDYWSNPTYGQPGHPGVYTQFSWGDAAFFLTDNRYHRAPNSLPDSVQNHTNPNKPYFGPEQLQWLKDGLATSKATFKFVVVGNQVLNKWARFEGIRHHYPYTFKQLLTFIKEQKIDGVIFLSGDRHMSELLTYRMDDYYTLYEFTCSPLTSHPYTGVKKTAEFNNPQRVDNTLVVRQNFGKITITGPKKERKAVLQTFDKTGNLIWEHSIRAKELAVE